MVCGRRKAKEILLVMPIISFRVVEMVEDDGEDSNGYGPNLTTRTSFVGMVKYYVIWKLEEIVHTTDVQKIYISVL